ncbi:MAG: hypothetical protein BAJALOKI2v1_230021 [Promethearchaeota archaeon]|nr:MAG: hypothetical protein BAJALOKI2v1_230021 [Candidatus Lokiarchaeota archaeon]
MIRELDRLFEEQIKIHVDEYARGGRKRDIEYVSYSFSFDVFKYVCSIYATLEKLEKRLTFSKITDKLGITRKAYLQKLAKKGEDYDLRQLYDAIMDSHKPNIISYVGKEDYKKYFKSILETFKEAILDFTSVKFEGGTRVILIKNIIDFKTENIDFWNMLKRYLNKILFRDIRLGSNYKIHEFIKSDLGGAEIDMLRYNIESLTKEDFLPDFEITDQELDAFIKHSIREIMEWRKKYDSTLRLLKKERKGGFDRMKAQILALREAYRTVVAYLFVQEGLGRKESEIKGMSYLRISNVLESLPFKGKFSIKTPSLELSKHMLNVPLKKEYIDNIRRAIIYIKKQLIKSQTLANRPDSKISQSEKRRLDWMVNLAEKTQERLKFLARLDLFDRFISIRSSSGGLFADQFDYKPSEVPTDMSDFNRDLKKTKGLNGYFERHVYKKRDSAKISYRGSDLSAGPFTTKIKHEFYINNLYPKFRHSGNGIVKVENSQDINILQSLMEPADPSRGRGLPKGLITKYQGQPHHYHFIPAVFKNKYVIATEVPVYIHDKAKSAIITGHIDMVVIVGKNIYICDYKPERDFSFNPTGTQYIYADTIPQISTYALIFKEMYAEDIKKGGYNVYTFTFNHKDGIVADPYKSLKMYTDFYEMVKPTEPAPPWKWVLEQYKRHWSKNL